MLRRDLRLQGVLSCCSPPSYTWYLSSPCYHIYIYICIYMLFQKHQDLVLLLEVPVTVVLFAEEAAGVTKPLQPP